MNSGSNSPRRPVLFASALAIALGLLNPSPTQAQTQTYPCETVMQFGTGMSANGSKLRPGSIDPFFDGVSANFPAAPNAYVVTNPPGVWIANTASPDSQWIGPTINTGDDLAGTYQYRLRFTTPCAGGRAVGRWASGDRGVLRLNGAAISFPTPSPGYSAWTAFTFNNLPAGVNTLDFHVTNAPSALGGPAGPTGLRAELTVTATCCPCIVLTCPPDLFATTCSNGAPVNFSISGTNRCYTNLTINCSLAASTGIPVVSGSVFPVGTNNVICTASDPVGHTTNCSFRVVVKRDSRPPDIRCPDDIVYLCGTTGTNVFFNVPAVDDTDPAPVVVCTPPSGSFFPAGTNRVTCQAADSCGRVSKCDFNILIVPGGFTKTIQAGVVDNFLPGAFEPTASGACLGGSGFWSGMPFDTSWPGRHLSHSFGGLPANISAAKLILHMKPTQPASQDDVLRIGLVNCGGAGVWAFAQQVASLPGAGGTWNVNPATTFTLDLAALPGGINLLANLNTDHRLEFAVGTETMVDYARLELTYCGPQSTVSGVPYSLNNVYPIHQGEGVSWRTVNSNDPPILDLDFGGADGLRLEFEDGYIVPCFRVQLPGEAMPALVTILEEPAPSQQTRISLSQPGNARGKSIEVWNAGQLVSRQFLAGPGDIAALVPANASVNWIGINPCWFIAEFQQPVSINVLGGVPAGAQPGPVLGDMIRLSYLGDPDAPEARMLRFTFLPHGLDVTGVSLLRGYTWMRGHGNQQLTISDAILSKPLLDLFGWLYGNCINATPGWMIELQNPVADFCHFDGISEVCSGGYVDVNIKAGLNFGGLRLTPTVLPLDVCRIDNTVANSTANSVVITRTTGGPITLNNVTTVETLHWPVKITGTGGPQSFAVDLPANTTVTASGQTYNATRVTFNASPLVLAEYYQVCLETVNAPQISMFSLTSPPTNSSGPACLTLSCPTGVVANCTGGAGTVVTFNPSGATRCGSNVVVTCVPPSGSLFQPGITVVHCTAIDSQGNQDQCRFLVTVRDATPPVLVMPQRLIVPCEGPRGAVVEFAASAEDGCDPAVVLECRPPSGSTFPVGTNYVTCTAIDAGGNRSSQEFPVIVVGGCAIGNCVDVTVPGNIVVRCNTAGGAIVSYTATARDTCTGGQLTPTCVPRSGSVFSVGETRVVCTARSGANEASAAFIIEVIDDVPPEIFCPSNLVVAARSERGAIVNFTVTGRDDCAPNVRVRCSPPGGSVFPVGVTRVTCEGADGNGNVSSCVFTVTVNKPTPLQITTLRPGTLELRWEGDAIVEFTDVLDEEATWTPMLNPVPTNFLVLQPTGRQRFFRLQLLDLLPPPDGDGDGVPDSRDRCPNTPAGLAVDVNGCSYFDLVATPEDVVEPDRARGEATLRLLEQAGGFSSLLANLTPQLAPSNNPAPMIRERQLPLALTSQSMLVQALRGALEDFAAMKQQRLDALRRTAPVLDAAHTDIREEDLEVLRLEEIEQGLVETFALSEDTLGSLSNVVRSIGVRPTSLLSRIGSIDSARRTARLGDGRLLLLPFATSPGAPPIDQIRGIIHAGGDANLQIAELPDGSLYGFQTEPALLINSSLLVKIDPRCLRLRVVPANPSLPDYDSGTRHHLRAYKWGFSESASYHFLEYGMAFAATKINCDEGSTYYRHWLTIEKDTDNDGSYGPLFDYLDDNSTPKILRPSNAPQLHPFKIRVREYRSAILPDGSTGPHELLGEDIHIIELYPWSYFANALYSRAIFELEDRPDETSYQTARVTDLGRQFPLTLQTLGQQTFSALGYTPGSFPNMNTVGLNQNFGVYFRDPNLDLFFAYTNDIGRGLYGPTVRGNNHGKPFSYRVTLPKVVRDRLHTCTGTDTYYRIPLFGSWHVSQGNNGDFTHKGNQKYAFDFPKDKGTLVLAARGGVVVETRTTGCFSCWDPDAINEKGEEGDCVDCTGSHASNFVKILHQDGTAGVYIHFKKSGVLVSKGKRIYRGDVLGKVGTTGCSTGPHLHFHVVENPDSGVTIPVKFETYDDDDDLRNCYVPPHNSDGTSTNFPWDFPWPF